jgi:serine/threonine protein kinase
MEYVDGLPLDEHINNVSGPINEEQLIPLFLQILDAFEYAHKNKIVHRDIKPSNIIITKDGKIKVLDFGIAKIMDETNSMTKTGTQMGSVLYMSPEQVKGEKVNHLSDIYSLGVTLYQMATGKAPYDPTSNEYEVFQKIDKEALPKASTIYPGISKNLEEVIEKATTKDGSKRFQSCKDFKNEIEKLTNKEVPEKAKEFNEPTKTETIEKEKKKKNPILIYLIIGVLLAGVGGYFYFDSLPKEFTNYYDKDWEKCKKENAEFYRIISLDKQGKSVGIVKDFFITGELQWEGYLYYYDEFKSSNDSSQGIAKMYYKNGQLERTLNYEKNLLNGKVVNYDSLGFKINEGEYKMGVRDGITKFYENGLRGIVPVNNDEIKHFLTYKNDTLNGKVETDYGYFGDSLKIEGNFKNGELNGYGKWVWLDGTRYEGVFKNGLRHGTGKYYYADGEIESGIWENGELVKKEEFKVPIEVKDEIFYKNKSNNNHKTKKKENYPTLKEVLKEENSKISENKKVKKFKFYDDFEDPYKSAFKNNLIEEDEVLKIYLDKLMVVGIKKWYEENTSTIYIDEIKTPFYVETEFEFLIKKSGFKNLGSGIFYGKDLENYMCFLIEPNNQIFRISEIKNSSRIETISEVSDFLLKGKNQLNKIKIEFLSKKIDFYINDSKVYTLKNNISGSRIGYLNHGKNTIYASYFKVESL